jgi:hypothetical protein
MFFVIDLHRFGLFEFSNWMKVLLYGTKSIRWEISNDRSVSETQQAVGPALTFAFREAVFALVMMENELFPQDEC